MGQTVKDMIAARYVRARAAFDAVPERIRLDLWEALNWARDTLRDHEGAGHDFQLVATGEQFQCCFAKPQWNADHCSQTMETAQEAIVMAVCEYMNGV